MLSMQAKMQRQTFGALVAFKQTACSSTHALSMLVLDVSDVMKKPRMEHQEFT